MSFFVGGGGRGQFELGLSSERRPDYAKEKEIEAKIQYYAVIIG